MGQRKKGNKNKGNTNNQNKENENNKATLKGQNKKDMSMNHNDDVNNNENSAKEDNTDKKKNTGNEQEEMKESGTVLLDKNDGNYKIELFTIIGEIEGHENLGSNAKTTKYEHIIPRLAAIEDNAKVDGILFIFNTMGGDVEAGLAIAELIASVSKPTVSLVLGGSHSIGIPIACSTDYSFIVPTATMVVHPVRMNGTVIGAKQTFDYFKQMQERISSFVAQHSGISRSRFEELMMETKMLTKDVGTLLDGESAVREGIVDEIGGLSEAMRELKRRIKRTLDNDK